MINPNSKMAQTFWETGKLPCPIIDVHAHMHEHPSIYFPAADTEGMMRSMNNFNIRWLFFFSHLSMYNPDIGEKYNMEGVRMYPDRLRAYHAIHSRHPNPDKHIREMEDNPDIYVGCKILGDYNRFPIDDPVNFPYYEYLNETGKLLLLHTWGGSPVNGAKNVYNIANRYPNIPIICGHSFFGKIEESIDMLKEFPNIYYELTAIPIVRGYLEDIIERTGGTEKILFGTDLPWFSTMHGAGMILDADISDEDRENIFYKNADKILKRFDWYKLDY